MTLEQIQSALARGSELTTDERSDLWEAIQALDEPMRGSLSSTYVRKFCADLISEDDH